MSACLNVEHRITPVHVVGGVEICSVCNKERLRFKGEDPGIPALDDPPLGVCPAWCTEDAGHQWEDEWLDGPVRTHAWFEAMPNTGIKNWPHRIGIEEHEVRVRATGLIKRQRRLVIDANAPTEWDKSQAFAALRIAFKLMQTTLTDWPPDGEI